MVRHEGALRGDAARVLLDRRRVDGARDRTARKDLLFIENSISPLLITHFLIGPCATISFCIARAPEMWPYSAMVAFGKWERPTHSWPKVPHVRATFIGVQLQSPCAQVPSCGEVREGRR